MYSDFIRLVVGTSAFPNAEAGTQIVHVDYDFGKTLQKAPIILASWCDNEKTFGFVSFLTVFNVTVSGFDVSTMRLKSGYEWNFNWIAVTPIK